MEILVLSIINKYGIMGFSVVVALIITLKISQNAKFIPWIKSKFNSSSATRADLLFIKIEYHHNNSIPRLTLDNYAYEQMLRIILTSKLRHLNEFLACTIRQVQDNTPKLELFKIVVDGLTEIISFYEKDSLDAGVPPEMLSVYWDASTPTHNFLLNATHLICTSADTNRSKLDSILVIIMASLEVLIDECHRTENMARRRIGHISFRGKLIRDCEKK